MKWLHLDEGYWRLIRSLPDIKHPKYAYEVEQQVRKTLGEVGDLGQVVKFLDIRISEFEKKMLYHDEFDTLVNRAKLSELVFLRKRISTYQQEKSIEGSKKEQKPFNVMHR